MEYLWHCGGVTPLELRTLNVESFLSEINGHHLPSMIGLHDCAFSFEACIAAGFVASYIITNTPELYDMPDEYKQAVQHAAILFMMCEPAYDSDRSRTIVLRSMVKACVEKTQSSLLEAVIFMSEKIRVIHDSRVSILGAAEDAQRIALMLLPDPKLHVNSKTAWTISKYSVEMAPVSLRTKSARSLYERMLPSWQTSLDSGLLPFVHPITARILQQQEIIANAQNAITEITEECKHPAVHMIVEHKGDTGNWSESDDSYARKETCTLCGRHEYWNKNHGERDYTLLSTTNHRLPIKT